MADGTLSLRYINDAWTLTKPNGTVVSVEPTTHGIPEAMYEAVASGYPLFHFGRGPKNRIVFTSNTLIVPAQMGGNYFPYSCVFQFNNAGTTKPGVQIDTFSYGLLKMGGCQILYDGDGPVVLIRPTNTVPDVSAPVGQQNPAYRAWLRHSDIDLGTLVAIGGRPRSLVTLDTTAVISEDPNLTTAITANIVGGIKFIGEGFGKALHALEILSPTSAKQLVSQNAIRFYAESCLQEEAVIGDPNGQFDNGIGSNFYEGALTHSMPPPVAPLVAPGCIIRTNAPWDQWHMNAINNESGYNLPSIMKFGANAHSNTVITRQAFGATVFAVDQNATPTKPNVIDADGPPDTVPSGPPPTSTILRTTGEPFTAYMAAGTWTYIDMSTEVPNGKTVTALWLYAVDPMTVPLTLLRRNSAGSFTDVLTQSITHTGGGWQSVSVYIATPNDGLKYYVGVYTTGRSQSFIDMKPRGLYASQITGTVTGVTEETAHVQWYVIPVGVTYQ